MRESRMKKAKNTGKKEEMNEKKIKHARIRKGKR